MYLENKFYRFPTNRAQGELVVHVIGLNFELYTAFHAIMIIRETMGLQTILLVPIISEKFRSFHAFSSVC